MAKSHFSKGSRTEDPLLASHQARRAGKRSGHGQYSLELSITQRLKSSGAGSGRHHVGLCINQITGFPSLRSVSSLSISCFCSICAVILNLALWKVMHGIRVEDYDMYSTSSNVYPACRNLQLCRYEGVNQATTSTQRIQWRL